MLEGLSDGCLRIDQHRSAQRRCNRCLAAIILGACEMRLDDCGALRL